MIAWLEARAWQVGTIGAAAVALGLAVALSISTARLHDAQTARDALQASIDAPGTGWAARLTTCTNNTATLKAGIEAQNGQIEGLRAEGAKRLAEADKAVTAAQRDAAKAQAKIAALMKPLVGADTCLRVIEADERLLETLK
jgi:hypothetical protein